MQTCRPRPQRQVLDDGRVAISYESRGGTIRALPSLPGDAGRGYVAVGEVTHLTDGLAKLHGFAGRLSRRHMRLIVRLLVGQGYRVAYIDRDEGRAMPLAERITAGDWAGWWRLDLRAVAAR